MAKTQTHQDWADANDATTADCYDKRDQWLNRAVDMEAAGKSDTLVNLGVRKAGEYEAVGLARA